MNDRYHRQVLLPFVGAGGQSRLSGAHVLLIGCGALGCVIGDQLARAGVGFLRVVDRDVVELTNLQRQILFDESDAREGTPKAVAAAARLGKVNSTIKIEPIVADVHANNLAGFAEGIDLILDGTDNVETRYLINDLAVESNRPWIYGACVGGEGRMMTIRPGVGPCLRCVFPNPPAAGELPTCDTAGVLGPAALVIGALQTAAAIALLTDSNAAAGRLVSIDIWNMRFGSIDSAQRREDCICCGQRKFEFLERSIEQSAVRLCGSKSVQIRPAVNGHTDLSALAKRLSAVGQVRQTPFLVRCQLAREGDTSLTIFGDGRTIVHGTDDLARARAIFSRYVGS